MQWSGEVVLGSFRSFTLSWTLADLCIRGLFVRQDARPVSLPAADFDPVERRAFMRFAMC
jgi:hypothetical protein